MVFLLPFHFGGYVHRDRNYSTLTAHLSAMKSESALSPQLSVTLDGLLS